MIQTRTRAAATAVLLAITFVRALPSVARGNEKAGEPVVYDGAILMPRNQRFDRAAIDRINKDFPDLPMLTKLPKDPHPPEFLAIHEPTVAEFGLPDDERLKYRGTGLSPEDRKSLTGAQGIWAVMSVAPREKALTSARRADQVMLALAELTGGVIYDDSTRQYYSRRWWKEHRLAAWDGDVPDVARFVTIDLYRNDDQRSLRAISLGMSKFGLPDVVVNDLAASYSRSMGTAMNLAMQMLVEGAKHTDEAGRPVTTLLLDLDAIRHSRVRERTNEDLFPGAARKITVRTAAGKHEEGDPPGALLEITFADEPGRTPAERHSAALTRLLGAEDTVHRIKHNEELLAASARAKQQLPRVRERFAKGLGAGERLIIKGPFEMTSGGSEWMWVEVTDWPPGEPRGILINDPQDVPGLKYGSRVTVKEADVFDYIWYNADGSEEGGETVKLMQRRQKQ